MPKIKIYPMLAIAYTLPAALLFGAAPAPAATYSPAINPPKDELPQIERPETDLSIFAAPTPVVEWTYHRTGDGKHPNGHEQALLWLMNRARRDPKTEGKWLATSRDPAIASGRAYFHVNTSRLQKEFSTYRAKPPAAFDARLYNAARRHSQDLIARNAQDHNGQLERVNAAGFRYSQYRGSVFSYATSALNAHAAFNIDWGGNDGSGMQPGRGHRKAIMSLDGDYANVGIAVLPESRPETQIGPWVATANYAKALTDYSNHFNRFIVGTVWRDLNNNRRFDPGEGYANVTVLPNKGVYFARTAAGGGYAIPITAVGQIKLKFSGGRLTKTYAKQVTVGARSVLADYQVTSTKTNDNSAADDAPAAAVAIGASTE